MHNLTPLSGLLGGALIGLAAAMLMLLTGRIAGVSGILGGLLVQGARDRGWRLAFIVGLIAAPLIETLATGAALPSPAMPASLVVVAIAGLLVGFGSRMGGGCTSGVRHRAFLGALAHCHCDLHGRGHRDRRHRASRTLCF